MSKAIQIQSKTFTVREMSVTELRAWWNNIATPGHACDVCNEYAVPGISLDDLAMLCDVDVSEFDEFTASDLAPLSEVARELNPHLFRLRETVAEASARVLAVLTEAYQAVAQGECHGQS